MSFALHARPLNLWLRKSTCRTSRFARLAHAVVQGEAFTFWTAGQRVAVWLRTTRRMFRGEVVLWFSPL